MICQEKLDTRFKIFSEEHTIGGLKYKISFDIKGSINTDCLSVNSTLREITFSADFLSMLSDISKRAEDFYRHSYPGLSGFTAATTEKKGVLLTLLAKLEKFLNGIDADILNKDDLKTININYGLTETDYHLFVANHKDFNVPMTFKLDLKRSVITANLFTDVNKEVHLRSFDYSFDELKNAAVDKFYSLYKKQIEKQHKITADLVEKANNLYRFDTGES
jgi:hypothetical protein